MTRQQARLWFHLLLDGDGFAMGVYPTMTSLGCSIYWATEVFKVSSLSWFVDRGNAWGFVVNEVPFSFRSRDA